MPNRAPLSFGRRHTKGTIASNGMLQNMWWICSSNGGAVALNSAGADAAAEPQPGRHGFDQHGDGQGPGNRRTLTRVE